MEDADTEPILGVVTLEEFRVAADPVRGLLVPVPGRLKRARAFALTPCDGRESFRDALSPLGRGGTP
jgi:hypothetical protein